ncbi:MAG: flagellar secretion chaperone FliS [Eubacteriales bacterium]|nr:flagellar secretion chaperone FliS [Eubacteriales bacterium]
MLYSNYSQAYRQTAVETAPPGKLILMLYDGALRFLQQAEEALVEGKREEAHKFLLRVQDIITELQVNLDFERGGVIAVSLNSLYAYFLRRLTEANVRKDPTPVREVYGLLQDLRQAWAEVVEKSSQGVEQKINGGLSLEG